MGDDLDRVDRTMVAELGPRGGFALPKVKENCVVFSVKMPNSPLTDLFIFLYSLCGSVLCKAILCFICDFDGITGSR